MDKFYTRHPIFWRAVLFARSKNRAPSTKEMQEMSKVCNIKSKPWSHISEPRSWILAPDFCIQHPRFKAPNPGFWVFVQSVIITNCDRKLLQNMADITQRDRKLLQRHKIQA